MKKKRDLWNAHTYTSMVVRTERTRTTTTSTTIIIIIITTTDDDDDETTVFDTAR